MLHTSWVWDLTLVIGFQKKLCLNKGFGSVWFFFFFFLDTSCNIFCI